MTPLMSTCDFKLVFKLHDEVLATNPQLCSSADLFEPVTFLLSYRKGTCHQCLTGEKHSRWYRLRVLQRHMKSTATFLNVRKV